jgi:phosphatidylserine/phosphatidylglycerophosphate/cardiolipin synthase-like enzyme
MARWTAKWSGLWVLLHCFIVVTRGCRLEVVAREGEGGVKKPIIRGLRALRRIYPKRCRLDLALVGDPTRNVHSKYFLISARYGKGAAWETLVFTGSVNFTGHGLETQDELLVKIRDVEAHARYVANFERLQALCPSAPW